MRSDGSAIPPEVAAYLRGYVRRRRAADAAAAAGAAGAGGIAWAVLSCVADRCLHLGRPPRLGLLAVDLAGVAVILLPSLVRLGRRRFDSVAAAAAVERSRPAFAERLVTVASRSSADPPSALAVHLARAVVAHLPVVGRPPVSWRPAAVAWSGLVVTAAVAAALWRSPWLDLPHLAERFADPWADVPAVTTTRLAVRPGDVAVAAGQPLTITATATGLPAGGGVTLRVSDDDGLTWSESAMAVDAAGGFAHALPRVDRDLRYAVVAGDAGSTAYAVSALRPPAVVEYRVRAGSDPPVVVPADGVLEVTAGAAASVDVVVTEPLRSAALTVGGAAAKVTATADPAVWRATFAAARGGPLEVSLRGVNGLTGTGPRGAAVRAVVDRPPVALLSDPEDDVEVAPRDVLVVRYRAADDHGLAGLSLDVRVNGGRPTATTVPTTGDDRPAGPTPRDRTGTVAVPLAPRRLTAGDYVTVRLRATDTAGHQTVSDPRHVLVAPRAADPDDRGRAADLAAAAAAVDDLTADLDGAAVALAASARADAPPEARRTAAAAADARLTAAVGPAGLLADALLRGVRHTTADAAPLATLADDAAVVNATLAVATGGRVDPAATAARLTALDDRRHRLKAWTRALADGAAAAVAAADRRGLAASSRTHPRRPATRPTTGPTTRPATAPVGNRFAEAWTRAAKQVADAVGALGLDPAGAAVDAQLKARADAGDRVAREARPVDLAAAARAWAAARPTAAYPPPIARQLAVASEVEALRPRSDLSYAGDLRLAAAAADATAAGAATAADRRAVADCLAVLQREHEQGRASAQTTAARAKLAAWAAAGPAGGVDQLAAAASAAVDRGDYAAADRLDAARRATLADSARPVDDRVRQAMQRVRVVDDLRTDQGRLTAATEPTTEPTTEPIADQEAGIVRRVEAARSSDDDPPTGRPEQVAALAKAQGELAALPGKLATVRERFDDARRTADRARSADPIAADAARAMAADADARLAAALRDATDPAGSPRLTAALAALADRATAGDAAGVDRRTAEARLLIEAGQRQLADAQEQLLRQDPLTAATWYARDAAAALTAAPPDVSVARVDQRHVAAALSEAWRQSAHRAAVDRLATVPGLAPVFGRDPLAPSPDRAPPDPPPDHDVDPPGYEEPLRAYFDGLARRAGRQ